MAMEGMEIPERLKPAPATVRSLYLRSGNLCAFPHCQQLLLDAEGVFVGKIAHISAANKGGPRFNPRLTNEERRRESNLILLCANHHEAIDQKPETWTIEVLEKIKREHEDIFMNPTSRIMDTIRDWTDDYTVVSTGKFQRFALYSQTDEADLASLTEEIKSTAERLRPVTRDARHVLATIIRRGEHDAGSRTHWLRVGELERAMHIDSRQVVSLLTELESRDFARLDTLEDTFEEPQATTQIGRYNDAHFLVSDLGEFCETEDISIVDVIVDLRFDLLD